MIIKILIFKFLSILTKLLYYIKVGTFLKSFNECSDFIKLTIFV